MQEVKDRLVKMLVEQTGVEYDVLVEKHGEEIFVDHGNGWAAGSLDSLDKVEFVMSVEEEFNVEIPDALLPGFKSIDDVARYVDTMTRGAACGEH